MIIKRLFDLLVSIIAVIVLSPLMVVAAIWIKADSRDPVFFRQERIGRNCVPFCIYKFRTMRVADLDSEVPLTSSGDPRITRAGEILRKYKIDELPQFFNVIKGEMSIVGPRPEVRKYVDCYPEEIRRKVLSIRPGITDMASIAFRNENALLAKAKDKEKFYLEEALPKKLSMYVEYVDHRSLMGDIGIIFRTFLSVVKA